MKPGVAKSIQNGRTLCRSPSFESSLWCSRFVVVTTLLNPEGYRIFEYVRTVVLDAGSQQLVAEWQPPRLNDLLGFLLFYCPFFLAIFTFIHARRKPDFTEMVLFFVFGCIGPQSRFETPRGSRQSRFL